jgi:hypothetical protein
MGTYGYAAPEYISTGSFSHVLCLENVFSLMFFLKKINLQFTNMIYLSSWRSFFVLFSYIWQLILTDEMQGILLQ